MFEFCRNRFFGFAIELAELEAGLRPRNPLRGVDLDAFLSAGLLSIIPLPQVLDLEKGKFEGIGIDDVVLDARKPGVRLVHEQFGDARRPTGLFELQLPVEKRHDDVIIFMTMPAGFCAGRESELGDPHMRLVDLDGCNSLWASGHEGFLSVGGIAASEYGGFCHVRICFV